MLTHLNKQSWTRQKTTLARREGRWRTRLRDAGSNLAWATMMLLFLTPIATYVGLLTLSEFRQFLTLVGDALSFR